MDPGYIKGYPVGIRENGGQYTHAALWTVIAYALKRDGDKAHLLFSMLNPINHASSRSDIYRYKVEPYVVAADIYSNPQHIGRGGWTWYTGSSGWMYRTGLEYILGFQIEGDYLRIDPCIPRNWPNFKMTYTYKSTIYRIFVDNSGAIGNGVRNIEVDGIQVPNEPILLADDKKEHHITVSLA
jgi:cyclic beta-1,2-glucan synthetase